MGKLSRDEVLKMANLARLELTESEVDEYIDELSSILQYVDMLQCVNVEGLKPTNQVTGLVNVTRPDEIFDYGYDTKELFKNLPSIEDDHIKVKRMIG